MLTDEATDKKIREQWATLAEPVRKAVLEGVYKQAVKSSVTDYKLDDEAEASVALEVLLYLVGLQNRAALQATLVDHPVLTSVQGKELFDSLNEKLFAPLAIYLDGEEIGGIDEHTIMTTITEDAAKKERLAQLPSSVRTVVEGDALGESFVTLARTHHLQAKQAKLLAHHVATVLVGLGTTNDFKVNVTRDTGLEPGNLETLFQDVEKLLFRPVRTAILSALEAKKAQSSTAPGKTDPYKAAPSSK